MNNLNQTTRALLALGRDGDDPSERDVWRNRKSLAARLGVASVLGTAAAASGSSVAAAAGGIKLTTFLACVALGGAVGTGVLSVSPVRERLSAVVSPAPDASPAFSMHAPSAPRLSSADPHGEPGAATVVTSDDVEIREPAAPRPEPSLVAPETVPTSSTRAARPHRDARVNAQAPSDPAPPFAAPLPLSNRGSGSLEEELSLVRAAEESLHGQDPARAIEAASEHERRFPDGAMWEEREVTWILGLCQTGNIAAACERARRFLEKAPASPFADRVREACPSEAPRGSFVRP